MMNAWRQCAEELAEAEAAWFDGDDHAKYLAWVHKWAGFARINLLRTADEVDAARADQSPPPINRTGPEA